MKLGRHQSFSVPEPAHPSFWNMSRLLTFYLEALLFNRGRLAKANTKTPKARFPSESLKRAWERAADACTAEDALESYQMIGELLDIEIDRVRVMDWPSSTKLTLLTCLHQQQVECANYALRLRQVIVRNERVVLPFCN
jgi:hypothetical protein